MTTRNICINAIIQFIPCKTWQSQQAYSERTGWSRRAEASSRSASYEIPVVLGTQWFISGYTRMVLSLSWARWFYPRTLLLHSRDMAVGIATGYGLGGGGVGVRVPAGTWFLSPPCRPDRFWGVPSLLSNGYRGLSGRSVKLTTHLLVPRSIIRESTHPLPHASSWRSA
jgi:hypothetical protein